MQSLTAKLLFSIALASLAMSNAWAHGDRHPQGPAKSEASRPAQGRAIGKPGDARKATRTVTLDMLDTMRFGPENLSVRQGETVRFILVNKGVLPHELVLGTAEELRAHAEEMRTNPHGGHDDPGAARVEPEQKKEIVWEFTKAGTVDFACLLPGHFEAGMVGKVKVTKG